MTPQEYFRQHPNACSGAQRFAEQFKSMRDAWMSDNVLCSWMLWAVAWDPVARPALLELSQQLVARGAENRRTQDHIVYLYDIDAQYYSVTIASLLFQMAINTGLSDYDLQQMIRKAVPDMFNDQPKEQHEPIT